MANQINVRLPESLLSASVHYAEKHGFNNVQELIKETLREKLFEQPALSKKELILVKKLAEISSKENLFGTEEELFKRLRRRQDGIRN